MIGGSVLHLHVYVLGVFMNDQNFESLVELSTSISEFRKPGKAMSKTVTEKI